MSKKEPIVARVSLGFTEADWKKFLASLTAQERTQLLENAAYASSAETIGQEHSFAPLACDLSYETPQEMVERLGGETPLATARRAGLEDGAEAGSTELWFRA